MVCGIKRHQDLCRKFIVLICLFLLVLTLAASLMPGIVITRQIVVAGPGAAGAGASGSSSSGGTVAPPSPTVPKDTYAQVQTYSVFEYCMQGVCKSTTLSVIGCTETISRLRCQGAFLVFHAVGILGMIPTMIGEINNWRLPVRRLSYILFFWSLITLLIVATLMITTLYARMCGVSYSWSDRDGKIGPAFPILVLDFFILFFTFIGYRVAMVAPEEDEELIRQEDRSGYVAFTGGRSRGATIGGTNKKRMRINTISTTAGDDEMDLGVMMNLSDAETREMVVNDEATMAVVDGEELEIPSIDIQSTPAENGGGRDASDPPQVSFAPGYNDY